MNREGFLQWIFSRKWVRYLGNVSFSFFLYHVLALMLARFLLKRLGLADASFYVPLHLVSALAISLALSSLSFALVEKRYFRARN
jgi:peptidoglycan/LPS O-acetylase OafA/YrhL